MRTLLPVCIFLLLLHVPARALEKWLYVAQNLAVEQNVADLERLLQRAHAAGYTYLLLADSKFARLDQMPPGYFKNVDRIKAAAAANQIEIVPSLFDIGYSNNLLFRDPNLVEALPVRAVPLTVQNGAAHVDDPEAPKLPGGDFTNPKRWSFYDANVITFENGTAHVADPKGQNARLSQKLKVQPWRQYHVSVRIKTDNFKGKPEIKALAGQRQLNWEDLGTKPTQDWTLHHAVFNSEDNTEVSLYFGVWGGTTGSLWWKDAALEEIPFLNMPRRPGTPLVVTTFDGKPLKEGADFEPLADPSLGQKPWPGEYDTWHEPPVLRTKLPDGTKLRASYFNAQTVYEHQAMICPSEPKTLELLREQARLMHKTWQAKGYMMAHDEIRVLNWCDACRARHLTPGQILADNVRHCIELLREVNPAGRIYVWSDMFDPNHNAVKGPYYLVNGSLEGSWEGLDKDVTILPWLYGKRAESLKWFADRGNKQVIAGYYDANPAKVADWLTAAKGVSGSVVGVMYTTWRKNYADLEKFAEVIQASERP